MVFPVKTDFSRTQVQAVCVFSRVGQFM